jgi:hypothetical protein
LTLLWAHAPSIALTTWWPLDTKHAPWLQCSFFCRHLLHSLHAGSLCQICFVFYAACDFVRCPIPGLCRVSGCARGGCPPPSRGSPCTALCGSQV